MRQPKKKATTATIPECWATAPSGQVLAWAFPTLAEKITELFHEHVSRKGPQGLDGLYAESLGQIEGLRGNIRKRFGLPLPEPPGPMENPSVTQVLALADYCKRANKLLTNTKQQPWANRNSDYMPLSIAIPRLADGQITIDSLSKTLTPGSPMRHMRIGRRCKVHIGDFMQWWESRQRGDAEAERLLETLETRKAEERSRRTKQP